MGRYTTYRPLPDSPYDPRVTDINRPLSPPKGTGPTGAIDTFRNKNIANTTPIQLVGGIATRALPQNPRRTGLMIQNKDAAATMFYSFGNSADTNSFQLAPGASALFDFTTPSSEVWLFSASASIQVMLLEMSRGF